MMNSPASICSPDRIGISRKGASTGASPSFALGDINLTSANQYFAKAH
jgi:hypothetical protein